MPAIFISYRKKDSGGHVGHLRGELEQWYGRGAVFTDFDSIDPGDDYMEEIERAVGASDVSLIVIGERWAASELDGDGEKRMRRIDDEGDVLRKEVAAALSNPTVKVVPVLVEDAEPLAPAELPDDLKTLSKIHVCRLRNADWDRDFALIRRSIDAAAGGSVFRRYLARIRIGAGRHRAAIAGVAALLAVALAALLLLAGGGGGPAPISEGCSNVDIPQDVRAQLSPAAGTRDPANYGVYYGTCHSTAWAIAEFPHVPSSVFVQEGFGWRMLGATAAVKCARVPHELLDEWKQDDC
jgi:TIR domain